jgi:hypothetical protein
LIQNEGLLEKTTLDKETIEIRSIFKEKEFNQIEPILQSALESA